MAGAAKPRSARSHARPVRRRLLRRAHRLSRAHRAADAGPAARKAPALPRRRAAESHRCRLEDSLLPSVAHLPPDSSHDSVLGGRPPPDSWLPPEDDEEEEAAAPTTALEQARELLVRMVRQKRRSPAPSPCCACGAPETQRRLNALLDEVEAKLGKRRSLALEQTLASVRRLLGRGAGCGAVRGLRRSMTFLAIDIGNTRLKWAQYAAPQPGAALLAHGAVFLEAIDELAETDGGARGAVEHARQRRRRRGRSAGAPRSSSRSGTSSRAGSCRRRTRAASPTATTTRTGSASTAGSR